MFEYDLTDWRLILEVSEIKCVSIKYMECKFDCFVSFVRYEIKALYMDLDDVYKYFSLTEW